MNKGDDNEQVVKLYGRNHRRNCACRHVVHSISKRLDEKYFKFVFILYGRNNGKFIRFPYIYWSSYRCAQKRTPRLFIDCGKSVHPFAAVDHFINRNCIYYSIFSPYILRLRYDRFSDRYGVDDTCSWLAEMDFFFRNSDRYGALRNSDDRSDHSAIKRA